MAQSTNTKLSEVLAENEGRLIASWVALQNADSSIRKAGLKAEVVTAQSRHFLGALITAMKTGELQKLNGPEWNPVKELLAELSAMRTKQGASPTETAMFVFSLKQPIFELLQKEEGSAELTWALNLILDKLGLFTTEIAIAGRQEVITRQQTELLELSTPVVKLWDGILALPLIGTLDSQRTQIVMETLLNTVVSTGAGLAIIDITGVPTVDTQVAQHLIKTVAAARLMGAECIISGIRPQIAATIVHLGVDLGPVTTRASLADAFAIALEKLNLTVVKKG